MTPGESPNIDRSGLSAAQVKAKREEFGRNVLTGARKTPLWKIFASQFTEILILLLVAAAVVAAIIGEYSDTIVILAAVLVNGILGFSQEYRAENAMRALKNLVQPTARVIRSGKDEVIQAADLVPGDLMVLERGDRITADAKLLEAEDLTVDESMVTGESEPVEKGAGSDPDSIKMGTTVLTGRGLAEITATGSRTELGRISHEVTQTEAPDTPLQIKLDAVGGWIGGVALVICVLVAGFEFLRLWNFTGTPGLSDFFPPLLLGVALAVAVIPEGLPIVVTITLAVSMRQIAKRKAIVCTLLAAETLGSATIICADKTGTLTMNKMTVRTIVCAGGEATWDSESGSIKREGTEIDPHSDPEIAEIIRAGILCSDANFGDGETVLGAPTETAIISFARNVGYDLAVERESHPRRAEIPFRSENKWMATEHPGADGEITYIKGAPEVIIPACTHTNAAGTKTPLSDSQRELFEVASQRLRQGSYRVLALAVSNSAISSKDLPEGLTLLGSVGMFDPPRPGISNSIDEAQMAGVRTLMLTGDHQETAEAICREVGIGGSDLRVATHTELAAILDEDLPDALSSIDGISRVTPLDKLRVVKALQANGEVVAMTGDGVNDAPALRQADIGIAMGSGTDVAKEAAGMVLLDDKHSTIVHAIEEGRRILDNIRRFLLYQLSTNVGAVILIILGMALLSKPEPILLPVQILWINILMDGPPALALGMEPAEPGIMKKKPQRRKEAIFTGSLILRIGWLGMIMGFGSFLLFFYADYQGLSAASGATMVFTAFVLFQLFNAFNARSAERSIFRIGLFSNRWLLIAILTSLTLQIMIVHLAPLQYLFHTTALGWQEWAMATAVASSVLFLDEMRKLLFIKAD